MKLENLTNNENYIEFNETQKLEKEIREFYENEAEAARLRSKTDMVLTYSKETV